MVGSLQAGVIPLVSTMRIALLNDDSLPSARGGAAVVTESLRREFSALGHEVLFIATHQDPSRERIGRGADTAGATISVFRQYPLRERHRRCLRDAAMSAALDALFREFRPDVVHAQNVHTYLTYDSLRIARAHTTRVFLTAHDTFLVSFDRVRGAAYEASALAGFPHRMHWWNHLRDAGRKYWPLRNRAIRDILRSSGTGVIAISGVLKNFLEANGIDVRAVVQNGVRAWESPPPDRIREFRAELGLTGPTILFGGRINADKGIAALLGHLPLIRERIPGAQILIAGDPARAASFLDAIDPALRQAVILAGHLSPEEMPVAYAAADVVATPSLYLDPFNLMNIEAMAAGKPVVGTMFGGTPEIVADGETGFVHDPRDPAYGASLVRLLKDPDLRERMGEAGRRRAMGQFSLRQQAEALITLYGPVP